MRHHTIALALWCCAGLAHAQPDIIPVKIAVACVSNPQCLFDGGHLVLELTVTNIQPYPVLLPVDYIKRRGPYIKLTDRKTNRQMSVGTGIPDYALRAPMTRFAPGEHFSFQWTISRYEIEALESAPVDASAEVTLVDLQGATGAEPAKKYVGKTSFRIAQKLIDQ